MNGLPASSRHKPRETDEAVLLIYSAERSVEEITDLLGIKPTPRRCGRLRTRKRVLTYAGELPDIRNSYPASDVTVSLDVGDPCPHSLRFVRHRTPVDSCQQASRELSGHTRSASYK